MSCCDGDRDGGAMARCPLGVVHLGQKSLPEACSDLHQLRCSLDFTAPTLASRDETVAYVGDSAVACIQAAQLKVPLPSEDGSPAPRSDTPRMLVALSTALLGCKTVFGRIPSSRHVSSHQVLCAEHRRSKMDVCRAQRFGCECERSYLIYRSVNILLSPTASAPPSDLSAPTEQAHLIAQH